jgi:hypothetical protein
MSFSLRRLSAITRKKLRHITRDFRIFFLVTLSPAFLLVILSYLFAFDLVSWMNMPALFQTLALASPLQH